MPSESTENLTITITSPGLKTPEADPIEEIYTAVSHASSNGGLDAGMRQKIERHARQIAFSGEDEDTETEFNRMFNYMWRDGAYATAKVLDEFFGVALGRPVATMFGDEPPRMIDIEIGPDESIQVPWGTLELPSLDRAKLITSNAGWRLYLAVNARRKHQAEVERFFDAVETQLRLHSIYRGKATIGIQRPQFLDVEKIGLDEVVYSSDTEDLLDGTLWAAIRHTDAMREMGLPLKRAVLLHGPYGTGKSLTGRRTARIAVENDWTYISAKAGMEPLQSALEMAKLYSPAVVFYEDVDTEAEPDEDNDEVSKLLDVFDGITAKDGEIVVVMTTNHLDRIHKGMLRPGRLDALVELSSLDQTGIGKIIVKAIDSDHLDELNVEEITQEMEGFTPAFVRETVTRAASVALARNGGSLDFRLTTPDLVTAARSLAPQLRHMEGAKEDAEAPTLGTLFEKVVCDALEGGRILDYEGDKFGEYGAKLSLNGKED